MAIPTCIAKTYGGHVIEIDVDELPKTVQLYESAANPTILTWDWALED